MLSKIPVRSSPITNGLHQLLLHEGVKGFVNLSTSELKEATRIDLDALPDSGTVVGFCADRCQNPECDIGYAAF